MIRLLVADKQRFLHPLFQSLILGADDIILVEIVSCIEQLMSHTNQKSPDVIALGLNLVESDRVRELFAKLQYSYLGVPILILLDKPAEDALSLLDTSSISGIFSKTDAPEQLIEAIRTVSQGNPWFSSSIIPSLVRLRRSTAPELSPREMEVLQLVAEEKTDKEIAIMLDISARTVRFHLESIHIKLGTSTRTGAVVQAIKHNLL